VYNVETYLGPLLDSLSALQGRSVEFIFVEDCSTDGSAARLAALLAQGPLGARTIQHEKNKGLSGARNTGLAAARGTYVWFVDSDDLINPAELPEWFEKLETHQPDVLIFDFAVFKPGEVLEWQDGHPVTKAADVITRSFFRSTKPRKLLSAPHQAMADALRDMKAHAWSYCFRRSLLPADPFPQGRVYEDLATTPLLLHAARTVYYHPVPMIYYRYRADSITKFASARRDLDLGHCMQRDWQHIASNRSAFTKAEIVAYLGSWLKTQQWSINNLHAGSHLYEREAFDEYMSNWKAYRRAAGWQHVSAIMKMPKPTMASRLAALLMTISPRLLRFALTRYRPVTDPDESSP
jgi:glycosyltransferase involved in cell wall biosynthesis